MPTPLRLSEEEMRRIEAEELAALKAAQEQQAEAERRMAAHTYRQEVRQALRPRPLWWPVRWALPFVPVIAGVLYVAFRPPPAPAFVDDAAGGISSVALMERCQTEVLGQLGSENYLVFPSQAEAAGQFSANADGKRWDGWVLRGQDGAQRTDFSCTFTAAENSVQVELIREDTP